MTVRLALSLWQPWASFVVEGVKRFETRSWSTRHRGPLLIHAGQPRSRGSIPPEVDALAVQRWGSQWHRHLPFGALLGEVDLVGVFPSEFVQTIFERDVWTAEAAKLERTLGDFSASRFAWEVLNPKAWTTPIPYAGRQRLFQADPDAARAHVHKLGEPVPSWWVGPVPADAGLAIRELRG